MRETGNEIRRRLVRLSSLEWSSHALCLEDFTITMFGFRFSAHTGGPPAVSYCFFSGVLGSTAATPSGLMLKAKNINGSLPGFPHWCTRAYGSKIKEPGPFACVLPST